MSDRPMQGKVALISGAARGQGSSHALRMAAAGADLVLFDICRDVSSVPYSLASAADLADTAAAARALGVRVVAREGDARSSAFMADLVAEAEISFGRLDVICANAGIASLAPVAELTDEMWDDMIGINLTGAFKTVRAALPLMRRSGEGGCIVFTTSTAATSASPNLGHYCSSKHGVTGLMRVLAKELASEGIRVNAVLPTSVNTAMIHNQATYARFADRFDGRVSVHEVAPVFQSLNLLPVPWVEPADVTDAVMWLISDGARMITGVQLPVDAGKTVP